MNEKLIEFVNSYNFDKRLKSLNYLPAMLPARNASHIEAGGRIALQAGKTPAQYLKEAKNISTQRHR